MRKEAELPKLSLILSLLYNKLFIFSWH